MTGSPESNRLLGKVESLSEEHQKRHRHFQALYRDRSARLLETLLPEVSPEALGRLSRVGFGLGGEILKTMTGDRKRCEDELASVEQRWAEESHSTTERVAEELDKLEEHLAALQPFLKRCFEHPRFDSLLLEGYGTDQYRKRFWHLSYHMDRRAALEIEEMCDGRSFASIRREAVQALEASQVLKQRIATLKERQRGLVSLAQQKKTLQSRLERHSELWLTLARRKLLELLENDPVGTLEKCGSMAPDELFEWRLFHELCKEHWSLQGRFLDPAREAARKGLKGTYQSLLDEYSSRVEAMRRFGEPVERQEGIDWRALIYGDLKKDRS